MGHPMQARVKSAVAGLIVATSMSLLSYGGMLAEVEVKVRNFAFDPRDVVIPMGETVKWVWESGSHTTTNGTGAADPNAGTLWDASVTSGSPMFSLQFDDEGVFPYFCRPHEDLDMKGTITVQAAAGVGETEGKNSGTIPRSIDISQNFPNPFNPSTTFTVSIPDGESRVSTLRIYSLRGTAVKTVFSERLPGGEYTFAWDGRSGAGEVLPSGVYIYRLHYGDRVISRKMTLLK